MNIPPPERVCIGPGHVFWPSGSVTIRDHRAAAERCAYADECREYVPAVLIADQQRCREAYERADRFKAALQRIALATTPWETCMVVAREALRGERT